MASQPSNEIVELAFALPTRVALDRVPEVLGGPDAPWLGEPVPSALPGIRQFACDLELQVSPEGRATFRKSAIVGLGEPRREGTSWLVEIHWRAGTLAPLFPVFAGTLRLEADEMELFGHYAPPGGRVGYVLDRALLHIAARRTAAWLVRKIALAVASPGGAT